MNGNIYFQFIFPDAKSDSEEDEMSVQTEPSGAHHEKTGSAEAGSEAGSSTAPSPPDTADSTPATTPMGDAAPRIEDGVQEQQELQQQRLEQFKASKGPCFRGLNQQCWFSSSHTEKG